MTNLFTDKADPLKLVYFEPYRFCVSLTVLVMHAEQGCRGTAEVTVKGNTSADVE